MTRFESRRSSASILISQSLQVNIIPVIGKSDACTKEELKTFKEKILHQLVEHEIDVYNFPADEGQQSLIPFAVVGSNVVVQDENGEDDDHDDIDSKDCHSGKKVRGRRYPWGTVNIEDPNHCDFLSLRSLVLAHHMQVGFNSYFESPISVCEKRSNFFEKL